VLLANGLTRPLNPLPGLIQERFRMEVVGRHHDLFIGRLSGFWIPLPAAMAGSEGGINAGLKCGAIEALGLGLGELMPRQQALKADAT